MHAAKRPKEKILIDVLKRFMGYILYNLAHQLEICIRIGGARAWWKMRFQVVSRPGDSLIYGPGLPRVFKKYIKEIPTIFSFISVVIRYARSVR